MAEEKRHQDKVLADLRSFGKYCECFKIIKASDVGEPDIFFSTALTGAVLLEMKRTDGVPMKRQELKVKKLNQCGVKAFLCHSVKEWIEIRKSLGMTMESIRKAHEDRNDVMWESFL